VSEKERERERTRACICCGIERSILRMDCKSYEERRERNMPPKMIDWKDEKLGSRIFEI
jgi:hypothetical protein